MFLFSTENVPEKFENKLIKSIANLELKKYKTKYFQNKETQIILEDKVENKLVVVLATISPPLENLWETFLLCHTLNKEEAKKIFVIFPYLAYMRHEKNEPQKSMITDLIAKMALATGVNRITTIDLHSQTEKRFFKMPIISLSPAKILAEKIKAIKFLPDTIVAPDKGAINRTEDIKKELNIKNEMVVFEKKRLENKVQLTIKKGKVGKKIIIVDDILDTGKTLLEAVKQLVKLGAEEIVIVVTHGLFTGKLWQELFKYKVTKIITTDTLPRVNKLASSKIVVVPVDELLIQNINGY